MEQKTHRDPAVVADARHYSPIAAPRQRSRARRAAQDQGPCSYARRAAGGATMGCPIQMESTTMSDDKSKSQGQDRQRINVNQDYELRDWAKSMNTTPERIKEAVQAVGDRADKVREYLSQDKPNR
jgi:hypothetical protein